MSLRSNEAVIRMGPITIISLLIVIALATLSVLSLTTAQASKTAASKQGASITALYANEREAQQFLSNMDTVLDIMRRTGGTPLEAAEALEDVADVDGITVRKSFESDMRKLTVIAVIREDLSYQIVSWKTEPTTDTSEHVTLWQGNES